MLDLTTIGVLASIFIAIVYLIYRDIRVIMQTVVDLREEFMMLQLGKQSLAQDDETGCYGEEHDEEDEDEEGGEDEEEEEDDEDEADGADDAEGTQGVDVDESGVSSHDTAYDADPIARNRESKETIKTTPRKRVTFESQ